MQPHLFSVVSQQTDDPEHEFVQVCPLQVTGGGAQVFPLFTNPERQLKSQCPCASHARTPFCGAVPGQGVQLGSEQPLLGPNRAQMPPQAFSPPEHDTAPPPWELPPVTGGVPPLVLPPVELEPPSVGGAPPLTGGRPPLAGKPPLLGSPPNHIGSGAESLVPEASSDIGRSPIGPMGSLVAQAKLARPKPRRTALGVYINRTSVKRVTALPVTASRRTS
jgi:hypothetical protein